MPVPGSLNPVLAAVSFTAPAGASSLATLDRLHLEVAWVYMVREPQRTPNCSGVVRPTATIPAGASFTTVLMVDAKSGAAYQYLGAGLGPCGPRATPELRRASLRFSVRFTLRKDGPRKITETVYLPACGRLGTVTYVRTLQAIALVPTGPCHGAPSTVVQHLSGRVGQVPYAPQGLVCGRTFDAIYGKPHDCVSES
jgi:hypothetical protein